MTIIDRIWGENHLIKLERQIWVYVMNYQMQCNSTLVTSDQLASSVRALPVIRLDRIHDREMVTKHDLMARLQEFAELSGHNRIHLGMTSADIVENSYLIRQRRSVMTLGLADQPKLRDWLKRQQFRGIRGPVGSDVDQLDLLQSERLVIGLNHYVANHFGFQRIIGSVAQCMPRSLDLELAYLLLDSMDRCTSQQRCLATGLLTMIAGQEFWLEGDIATSVVRRYAWPMLFKLVESYRMGDSDFNPYTPTPPAKENVSA